MFQKCILSKPKSEAQAFVRGHGPHGTPVATALSVFLCRFLSSATIGDTECVNVTINDEQLFEPIDEDFRLSLADPVNVTIGDPSTATVNIVDDDGSTGMVGYFWHSSE